MATEYKLSYTGSQINERLGMVDELSERIKAIDDIEITLENKQDALSFDSTPTEGSENPITSGGVYEALQNIDVGSGGGEGGNVALTAGDLLEIKDGVIRSTLGDDTGEVVEVFDEFYNISIRDLAYEEEMGFYAMPPTDTIDTIPEIGNSLDIYFTPADENTPIRYNTTVVDFQEMPVAFCNATLSENFEFAAIDESLPAFMLIFVDDDGEKYMSMYMCGDYTGATVSVGTFITEHKYVRLPDNALKAGDFIEIKDGVIGSTLGKTYTKLGEVTFFDSDILELVDSEIDEEDPAWSAYYYQDIYQGTFLDKPDIEEEPIDVEVKYYPPESDEFVVLKGLYAYSYDSKDDVYEYQVYANAKLGEDDLEIDNPNFPIIHIRASKYSDADEFEIDLMSYGQDITGARIVIDGEKVTKTTVKLPMSALTFDEEPTEGSTNLVSSGVVYDILENLENGQDELVFDDKPTAGSQNPVKSGGIYDAIRENKSFEKLSKYFNNAYLSVTVTTEGKTTTSDARINMSFSTIKDKQTAASTIYGNQNLAIIFSDTPNKAYRINPAADMSDIDDYSFYFKFYFANTGDEKFSTSDAIASRDIKELIVHYNDVDSSHAEGYYTVASGDYSHAEGYITTASMNSSHAEGYSTIASGDYSHAEGFATRASGNYSHAEGSNTTATGSNSHAEGNMTHATGYNSYAEGYMTTASGDYSHAEGDNTKASGNYSHAEGSNTTASGYRSHAEGGSTIASGDYSHAEGDSTIASGFYSHVQGKYNIEDGEGKYAHIVGNGYSEENRSNAHTLDWNGNAWFAGNIEAKSFLLPVANYENVIELVTSEVSSGDILGQNMLTHNQFYEVVYDGRKYTFMCETDGDSYTLPGILRGYGFDITQDSGGMCTFGATDENSHTISISRLQTSIMHLAEYIDSLRQRVQDLEAIVLNKE